MKRIFFVLLLSIGVVALVLAACQPTSPAVMATSSPLNTATVEPTNIPPQATLPPTPKPLVAIPIDAGNAAQLKAINQAGVTEPYRLVWSRDGSSFWVITTSTAELFDSQTFESTHVFNNASGQSVLDVSPDGHMLAITTDNQNIQLVDITSGKNLALIQTAGGFDAVSFSPDGSRLTSNSMDVIRADLWDTTNGQIITSLSGFQTAAPVYDASIGTDNKTLIWHARATITLQDIASQKMGATFSHEDFVESVALSPDGNLLAVGAGGTINGQFTPVLFLYNAHSGQSVKKIPVQDTFSALSFSPDGKLLGAASGQQVTIWDMGSLKIIASFSAHGDQVADLAFSPDGKTLLTCGGDNLVKSWQVLQP